MTQDRRHRIRRPLIVLVLAAAFALTVSGTASAAPTGTASQHPIKTVTVHSNHHKYVLKVWAKSSSKHCLAHAYGTKIRHFLSTHHCTSVVRYLVTTKVNGHGVGFAESVASFSAKTEGKAFRVTGEFRKLISEDGTGNFYSLFHDGDHVPSGPQTVPDPDAFKALAEDVVVTSVDAWYLHQHTTSNNATPLIQMIKNIYLQWFV
jgi:hypothetical protein